MIPRIIHYCWFGSQEMPPTAIRCMETWKAILPDYEFKLWNEENFDIGFCPYVKEAYEAGKFAFVSDVARLYALQSMGGIYLDTDVEVLKSFDPFLAHEAFIGWEKDDTLCTAVIGSEKNGALVNECLDVYTHIHFLKENGSRDMLPNTARIGRLLKPRGLKTDGSRQDIEGMISVYPSDYFSAFNHRDFKLATTNDTVSIHHMLGSWISRKHKFKILLAKTFGPKLSQWFIRTKKRLFSK